MIVVEEGTAAPQDMPRDGLGSLPFVVVGVRRGDIDGRWLDLCDVVVDEGGPALHRIEENVAEHPVTSTTLALLLRGQHRLSVGEGLVAESAAYSVLQSGPEFAAWRAAHPARSDLDEGPRVRIDRAGRHPLGHAHPA